MSADINGYHFYVDYIPVYTQYRRYTHTYVYRAKARVRSSVLVKKRLIFEKHCLKSSLTIFNTTKIV